MNEAAIKKHEIYGKLRDLSGLELRTIGDFIDFVRHKKRKSDKPRLIKLEGVLKGYEIDAAGLAKLRDKNWQHLEDEFSGE
ncbi:MAG: hypothetical protein BM485_09470 [Desulfobulbaceae bacterium DB1]|nr:MAG: hypothetical protein BM485_09470 [Desulfobulbaceae bacterium DB1]